jgi:hypothetical protein
VNGREMNNLIAGETFTSFARVGSLVASSD